MIFDTNAGVLERDDYMTTDEIVKELIDTAKKVGINKLILFGSRAKGTNHERSDFDLAIIPNSTEDYFAFVESLEELPTLLMFDVVDISSDLVSYSIKNSVEEEGIVLYEKV